MRNPYMKFQNPRLNFFFERTDERTSRKQYAPHFLKVGGIKMFFSCFRISVIFLEKSAFLIRMHSCGIGLMHASCWQYDKHFWISGPTVTWQIASFYSAFSSLCVYILQIVSIRLKNQIWSFKIFTTPSLIIKSHQNYSDFVLQEVFQRN